MTLAEQASPSTTREKLDNDLVKTSKKHEQLAGRKNGIVWVLLLGAIIAGGLVVVNVGTKWFTADGVSVLAGLSAVLLGILRYFKFPEQVRWHKLKQRKLEDLHRELIFEGKDVKSISSKLSKVLDELENTRVVLEIPGQVTDILPPSDEKTTKKE